jgi:amino-acid N-acetyltransferase
MPDAASTLRAARSADWPAIADLLTTSALPLDGAREHLDHFVVVEQAGALVGCAGVEPYGEAGLLRSVAVVGSVRGRGVGQQLVAACLERARATGLTLLVLRTTSADGFFARLGFERVTPDAVPAAVTASSQFRGVCGASAVTMQRQVERQVGSHLSS